MLCSRLLYWHRCLRSTSATLPQRLPSRFPEPPYWPLSSHMPFPRKRRGPPPGSHSGSPYCYSPFPSASRWCLPQAQRTRSKVWLRLWSPMFRWLGSPQHQSFLAGARRCLYSGSHRQFTLSCVFSPSFTSARAHTVPEHHETPSARIPMDRNSGSVIPISGPHVGPSPPEERQAVLHQQRCNATQPAVRSHSAGSSSISRAKRSRARRIPCATIPRSSGGTTMPPSRSSARPYSSSRRIRRVAPRCI